jgi:hypothetical protein
MEQEKAQTAQKMFTLDQMVDAGVVELTMSDPTFFLGIVGSFALELPTEEDKKDILTWLRQPYLQDEDSVYNVAYCRDEFLHIHIRCMKRKRDFEFKLDLSTEQR